MGVAQRSRRWLVPVTAVAVVAGVGALGPVVADASPKLPGISAQDLLAKVQTAKVDGLSGTVRSDADLGLPVIPGAPAGSQQLTEMLSGQHTARVAFASPDKARVSVLDAQAERVWTTDGKSAWAYDSSRREAVKLTVPEHKTAKPEKAVPSYDPQAVAKQFLDAIDPSTKVDVSGTEKVAGRDAYKLRLIPKTDKTTVGSVTLAIDSKTWVPLDVTVMPRTGNDPALEVGFSSVSFDVPTASTFTFTPPKGVKVTDKKVPSQERPQRIEPKQVEPKQVEPKQTEPGTAKADGPTVIGEGWESVAMIRGAQTGQLTGNGPLAQLLAKAPTVSGTWGKGKVLTSKMVRALITDDGRVFVGLVTSDTLQAAAAKAPR
ncbi:outer membrane lipoprotein carrier protein LolA [Kribbella speibonae]|uniref:Outer membrane lipoprotein carrier protein LolA n=1 Tax=Kribbella speibonae TaxID=1572660 RepID=A0ABY1ZTS7_9ACTN|nr:outer membrane lipoprotein carrier protein LolA [Kribbella speibonae]